MKTKRDNLPLVIALVLFGLMVAVMLLAAVVRTRTAGRNPNANACSNLDRAA